MDSRRQEKNTGVGERLGTGSKEGYRRSRVGTSFFENTTVFREILARTMNAIVHIIDTFPMMNLCPECPHMLYGYTIVNRSLKMDDASSTFGMAMCPTVYLKQTAKQE